MTVREEKENRYYLYRHIRLDNNEPFYIGIGTKPKKYNSQKREYSRAYSNHDYNRIWKGIVSKTMYSIEILMEYDDYEFILNKEIEFIALYGRIDTKTGTLSNMTDGGDGNHGRVVSIFSIHKQIESIRNGKGYRMGKEHHNYQPLFQYSLDGDFIKEWESSLEIEKSLGIPNSTMFSCLSSNGTTHGSFWSKTYLGEKINPIPRKSLVLPIIQVIANSNIIIRKFKNKKEAAIALAECYGYTVKSMQNVLTKYCNNNNKTFNGFMFKYAI